MNPDMNNFRALRAENPASFFNSREWKSYAAYRRPKGEVWDERKKAMAQLQRVAADALQTQYSCFLLAKKHDVNAAERLDESIANAEARARQSMNDRVVKAS